MTPEERAVLVDAVAKTLAPMRHGAGESYTIWNAEADEIVEKLFSPRVVPCSECGGTGWVRSHADSFAKNAEKPCPAGCDHGQASSPPLAMLMGEESCPNADCIDGWWWCDIGDGEMIRQRCGHASHRSREEEGT